MTTAEHAVQPAQQRGAAVSAHATRVVSLPRTSAPLRRLGAIGLLLAIPVVAIMTLWPTHFLLRIKPRVVQGIEWFHTREMFEWLYWTRLEVLANVAMFVPLALLLVFVLGARRWWVVLGLCLAMTVGIELTQYFMPGRVASLKDIAANGMGAVIGVLLAVAVEAIVRRVRRGSFERRRAAHGIAR
ncbi:VanZ family protein [Agrococcus baldri]|uniref:VanZ-like domain-containing protein n=1 Tax=Agrococcus baldri TaxID=153730 RepID=A0AA87RAX3_9MICO|nr:VanZ family protein [Agrococcus baldri]GEK79700.1 hypothetical protein ABA31_10510 [Agrococcus baldri]